MFVHLRVAPGFWIAVEESRRPELCSRPVVMAGSPADTRSGSSTVREANFVAQRSGVRPGMTLFQGRQYCPDVVFLVPDLPYYAALWETVCDILRAYTPLVEPVEMGQAACDLSGCERLWGDARRAAGEMATQIRCSIGVVPWLGIASNRLVAELASLTPGVDGMTSVEQGQERAFLSGLPVTLLPAMDSRLALTFQVLGIKTIEQLAALPASAMKQRFGAVGGTLHNQARGIDPRPVTPPPAQPSVSAQYQCEDGTLEEALVAIHRLAEACADDLQHRGLAGRLIELTLDSSPASPSPMLQDKKSDGPTPSLAPATDSQNSALSQNGGAGEDEGAFPISYRIHSMLPQPGSPARTSPELPVSSFHAGSPPAVSRPITSGAQDSGSVGASKEKVAVRIPIASAPPLIEQAQRLLLRGWPRLNRLLEIITLKVSEFEEPAQLSFAEFNRLDQTGVLGGAGSGRLQTLVQQEQILAARYGEGSFRHLAHVDPANVLPERRFHWQVGLPRPATPKRRKS